MSQFSPSKGQPWPQSKSQLLGLFTGWSYASVSSVVTGDDNIAYFVVLPSRVNELIYINHLVNWLVRRRFFSRMILASKALNLHVSSMNREPELSLTAWTDSRLGLGLPLEAGCGHKPHSSSVTTQSAVKCWGLRAHSVMLAGPPARVKGRRRPAGLEQAGMLQRPWDEARAKHTSYLVSFLPGQNSFPGWGHLISSSVISPAPHCGSTCLLSQNLLGCGELQAPRWCRPGDSGNRYCSVRTGEEVWLRVRGGTAPAVRCHGGGVEPSGAQSWAQSQDPEMGHPDMWAEMSAGTQRGLGGQHQGDTAPRRRAPPSHHVWEQGPEPGLRRQLVRERRHWSTWKVVRVGNKEAKADCKNQDTRQCSRSR